MKRLNQHVAKELLKLCGRVASLAAPIALTASVLYFVEAHELSSIKTSRENVKINGKYWNKNKSFFTKQVTYTPVERNIGIFREYIDKEGDGKIDHIKISGTFGPMGPAYQIIKPVKEKIIPRN